jgi:hypothetical protein
LTNSHSVARDTEWEYVSFANNFLPSPPALTGVGFLQLGGVRVVKMINRGRRKTTLLDEDGWECC